MNLSKVWDLGGLAALAGLGAFWFGGFPALYTVAILMVLEISLSFDNAIVNAKSLGSLSEKQQDWFLHWGFLIAVIGMRLIFPILIVSASSLALSPLAVAKIAIYTPELYGQLLANTHILIAGFGGAFLMMVALAFFYNPEKDTHWIWLERPWAHFGKVAKIEAFKGVPIPEAVMTAACLLIVSFALADGVGSTFVLAGLIGILLFVLVDAVKNYFEDDSVGSAVKAGVAALLFMEVRDASFSFDGVIGAFAINEQFILIMLGLGVGAYAVRKMTVQLVRTNTLQQYEYLEHGAFWAILALSVTMMLGAVYSIPEYISGSTGILFIAAALVSSIASNKKEEVTA